MMVAHSSKKTAADNNTSPHDKETILAQVLTLTQTLLNEFGSEQAQRSLAANTSLERDLGIGSLERSELFHRVEKHFKVRLSDSVLVDTDTLAELAYAIEHGKTPDFRETETITTLAEHSKVDPSTAQTLVDSLILHVQHEPNRVHMHFQDELGEEQAITYKNLYEEASKIAGGLKAAGVMPRETVAIMLPTCQNFFYSFFAILLSGAIPVPIYPPLRPKAIAEYATRSAKILRNAQARILITFEATKRLSKMLKPQVPSLIDVVTVDQLQQTDTPAPRVFVNSSDAGLIQYTSGSTGDPKGVLLTHQNLLSNIRAVGQAIQVRPDDRVVSWLPLYHDMGLIGAWLGSLYFGLPITVLSPITFINHPERWLWAIHRHHATMSAGPNFAYELCINKIDPSSIEGLDLSSWRLAFNGAEAIHARTLKRFAEKYKAYGFRSTSLFPVYGLAESTVGLTFPEIDADPTIDRVSRDKLVSEQIAIPPTDHEPTLDIVGCGKAIPGHEIRIVDENNRVIKERHVGQLQFRGPSSMQGYLHNPEKTKAIYHDGWWDSGDRAYMVNGEVFITGRQKDVIIKAGRNFYPSDVEDVVNQIEGIRKGCVIAFGLTDTKTATEKFVVVAEVKPNRHIDTQKLTGTINHAISHTIGLPPDHVVLAQPGTIPKTSSGKLRRSSCKQAYLSGKLQKAKPPVKLQLTQLFVQTVKSSVIQFAKQVGSLLYGVYSSAIILLMLLSSLLATLVLPMKLRHKACRSFSRLIFLLSGYPLTLEGEEHLQPNKALIYVANHASYLDSAILMAILPPGTRIVGKQELETTPILKTLVKRLGFLSVDRIDFAKSKKDTLRIEETVKTNHSVLIFPEGTFSYSTGLLPFKSGAFKVAVETNTPICPISIEGSRSVLRANQMLPRPGHIHVTVSEPIAPKGNDWKEIKRLQQLARQEIAKHCGETTLDLITQEVSE